MSKFKALCNHLNIENDLVERVHDQVFLVCDRRFLVVSSEENPIETDLDEPTIEGEYLIYEVV